MFKSLLYKTNKETAGFSYSVNQSLNREGLFEEERFFKIHTEVLCEDVGNFLRAHDKDGAETIVLDKKQVFSEEDFEKEKMFLISAGILFHDLAKVIHKKYSAVQGPSWHKDKIGLDLKPLIEEILREEELDLFDKDCDLDTSSTLIVVSNKKTNKGFATIEAARLHLIEKYFLKYRNLYFHLLSFSKAEDCDLYKSKVEELSYDAKKTRDKSAAKKFKEEYGYKCAVTGTVCKDLVQTAHVFGFSNNGPCREDNFILLRVDIHTGFDCGGIEIEADTKTVRLHGTFKTGYLSHLEGKVVENIDHVNQGFLEWKEKESAKLRDKRGW